MFSQDQEKNEQHRSPQDIPNRNLQMHINESDSEDDEVLRNARNTSELLRYDNGILEEDGGRDTNSESWIDRVGRLGGVFGRMNNRNTNSSAKDWRKGRYADLNANARPRRRGRRRPSEDSVEEDMELVFELEEGDGRTRSRGSSFSHSEKNEMYMETPATGSFSSRFWTFVALSTFVVVLFLALLYGSYRATESNANAKEPLANSTSDFLPTTILISLDGFRADFLSRGITPTLNSFIKSGISPKYMIPSFPSVTFPNHFTLVTGLYPESHGIIGNTFWDPDLQEEFYYTDPSRSMQSKWWTAEPIWVTAENQGIRSAVHMWPGSEAHINGVDPSYLDKFNADERLEAKVKRVLELVDLPGPNDTRADPTKPRPQLIAAYVPVVDAKGHKWGPNSTEIDNTIKNVDNMVNGILDGLDERGLADVVNVIVVSDHGMASTDATRLYQLEDLIDTSIIEHIDGWPLYGLRLIDKDPAHLDRVYSKLHEDLKDDPNIEVRLRSNMPEKYHFSDNDRIAPLWLIPKAGWAIVKEDEFNVHEALKSGEVYHPMGLHGYDHEHPLMRAIFVARGPAFPHAPGSRMEVFQNTEVYNLICDSIGIKALPNNGSLHLPLKPIGLHSDLGPDPLETVSLVESQSLSSTAAEKLAVTSMYQTGSKASSSRTVSYATDIPSDHNENNGGKKTDNDGDADNNDNNDEDNTTQNANSWLSWFKEKFNDAKTWIEDKMNGDKSK